jgi:hypothetical protein
MLNHMQDLQKCKNWPTNSAPQNLNFGDYASWSHPWDSAMVGLTDGQFRYMNDGIMTSMSDVYAFPPSQSDWNGGTSHHNAPLSLIPGTPYPFSGSWPTPL